MKKSKWLSVGLLLGLLTGCSQVKDTPGITPFESNVDTTSAVALNIADNLSGGVSEDYDTTGGFSDTHAHLWAKQCMGAFYNKDNGVEITKIKEGSDISNATGYALYDIDNDGEAELLIYDGNTLKFRSRANRFLGEIACSDINAVMLETKNGIYAYTGSDEIVVFSPELAKLKVSGEKVTVYTADGNGYSRKGTDYSVSESLEVLGNMSVNDFLNQDPIYLNFNLNYLYVSNFDDYAVEIKTQFYDAYTNWRGDIKEDN